MLADAATFNILMPKTLASIRHYLQRQKLVGPFAPDGGNAFPSMAKD
jgi:hypothetical protein